MNGSARFDAHSIRRLVESGKKHGLVRGPGEAAPIEKHGPTAAADAGVRSQWMDVDAAQARRWLDNNFRNRPLKEDVIDAYARDMLAGTWIATHQGVAFNDRDELIDGQHRLHAILRSGCTVRMMVTFGLPSGIVGKEMTTMDAVDRGRTRSVADQLKIQHGMKHGTIIAATCMSLAGLCYQQRTRRLSVGQTLEIYRAFEPALLCLIDNRSKEPGLRQAGVLAGFALALQSKWNGTGWEGAEAISAMYLRLTRGEGLKNKSAMKCLRAFLVSDEAKLLTRATDRGLAELVLQAIHLEAKGAAVAKLELVQEGADHYRAAQPERVAKVAAMFQLPKAEAKPAAA